MNKKLLLSSLFLGLLGICQCEAEFVYSGVFSANRQSNDSQSYYILLNENSNVAFSFKCQSESDKASLFVSKIKLSSEGKEVASSESGIKTFEVKETGIYEVSVETKSTYATDISYDLVVSDVEAKSVEEMPLSESNAPQSESIEARVEATVEGNVEALVDAPVEVPLAVVAEPLTADSPATEEETGDFSNVEAINSGEVELLAEKEELLSSETPAVEESLDTNETVVSKDLKYEGKLELVRTLDLYDFIQDKNKCWPQALCYDKANNLWTVDSQLCKIRCFSPKGKELLSFGTKGKENHELGLPVSLAICGDKILVGDRQKHCVHLFDFQGNWVAALKSNSANGLKISNPNSICQRNKEIWISDDATNRVLCFDLSFNFLGSFGSTQDIKIESIVAIDTDSEFIYLLEENGKLKKFGPMGNFESEFSTNCSYPTDLLVDANKNFWVTDSEKGGVICYSAEGKCLFSAERNDLEGLWENARNFSPVAISIGLNAEIAVADSFTKQVKIFSIK